MLTPNSIVHLAHVKVADQDYNIAISVCTTTNNIHIFKYDEISCAYEIFDNQEAACRFLEEPLHKRPRLGRGSH